MTLLLELRIFELLCSRLCHDLVSPVGAVNNGVELLEELGPDEEALKLVGQSAQAAARRLKFYRVAYGAAGAADLPMDELRDLMTGLLVDRHVALAWDSRAAIPFGLSGRRLLLNMLAFAAESLPRGGTIHVGAREAPAAISLTAEGAGATLPEGAQAAMDGSTPPGELTARTIQVYFASRLADALGARLSASGAPGRLAIIAETGD